MLANNPSRGSGSSPRKKTEDKGQRTHVDQATSKVFQYLASTERVGGRLATKSATVGSPIVLVRARLRALSSW